MTDRQTEKQTGYPSVDKPWIKYYKEGICSEPLVRNTVFGYVYDRNKDCLSDRAIKYFDNDISFEKMFTYAEKCTRSLLYNGIKKGDCINILAAGIPETIYIVLACSRIGAIANFINPLFEHSQMVDRINDTESTCIFIMDSMYKYVQKVLPKTCVKRVIVIPVSESFPWFLKVISSIKGTTSKILKSSIEGIEIDSWRDFISEGKEYTESVPNDYKENTPALMVYSSGSTGASKGILHTNDSINATLQDSLSSRLYYERGMTFLQMIPVWFSTGIVQSILLPLSLGVEVILEPRFDHHVFVKDVIRYNPVFTIVATSIWMAAIKNPRFQKVNLSKMLYPFTGGEKLIPSSESELNAFLKKRGCPASVMKGYGMCELGGKVTDSIAVNKPGSVGIPMAHITVGIFDPERNIELRYGEHGEIRVDSPAHMKEYYKNGEATEDFFWTDKEGVVWGCTGDIGYIDEDGLLFVLGRATDSCTLDGGEKIYLFDIEEEIIKDEAVNECKVIDTEIDGKTALVGHVVLREGNDESVLKRVDSNVKNSLPDYMVPAFYKIRQSMPVHSNGKRDVGALKNDKEGLIEIK